MAQISQMPDEKQREFSLVVEVGGRPAPSAAWVECDVCCGDGCVEYNDAGPSVWGEDCPSEENHLVACPECEGHGVVVRS